jgi:hypothetical protein
VWGAGDRPFNQVLSLFIEVIESDVSLPELFSVKNVTAWRWGIGPLYNGRPAHVWDAEEIASSLDWSASLQLCLLSV